MSLNSERVEIEGIVNRLLDNLAACVTSVGSEGAALRQQVGRVRSKFMVMLGDTTFGGELLKCFGLARAANVTLASLVVVREGLYEERPVGQIAGALVQMAVVFCLSAESRLISAATFVSRDDVESVINTMRAAFSFAREASADSVGSEAYRNLTFLAGALTNHLANTSLSLPRMVNLSMPKTLPALVISHRLYRDSSRWNELVDENKIVHPAFMPRQIRALSK